MRQVIYFRNKLIWFQHNCILMFIKSFWKCSLNAWLSSVMPSIPGMLKNSNHVLYCCCCIPESITKAHPTCWLFSSKVCPSDGPTSRSQQCEMGRLWRPQNQSVLSYLSMWIVRVQKLLYVAVKRSSISIMHKQHSLSCFHWYILL